MRDLLIRHELACRFLATVFHDYPAAAFINRLALDDILTEWPLAACTENTETGLRLMQSFCSAWDESLLAELEADFNRLFVGPGHPLAPPWESYYLSVDHLLFQEPTLAVRRAYRRFGLEGPNPGRAPDDSLGLELAFMAELYARRLAQDQAPQQVFEAQRDFFVSHLLKWAPQCLRLVIRHARLDYYRGAAFLALGCFEESGRELGLRVSF